MKVTWLHVSDFHIKAGDTYDQDVVLKALVKSVRTFCKSGRSPNIIFATGDVVYSGKPNEYVIASRFFDDLLEAAGLQKQSLFVVPGNHDVDRDLGIGLARTLITDEEADKYFNPDIPKVHLVQKQRAFIQWYNRYFEGIRVFPENSTCGPVEVFDIHGLKIGVLPLNSALFCQDDTDFDKLWIGRRCIDDAIERLQKLGACINVAIVHHPLDWLNSFERSNIKYKLHMNVDIILQGHLHETGIENVIRVSDSAYYLSAGATYQTRKWPNCSTFITIEKGLIRLFPIRYEDKPNEVWTIDPSLFPFEPNNEKSFPIKRLLKEGATPPYLSSKVSVNSFVLAKSIDTNKLKNVMGIIYRRYKLNLTELLEPDTENCEIQTHSHTAGGYFDYLIAKNIKKYSLKYWDGSNKDKSLIIHVNNNKPELKLESNLPNDENKEIQNELQKKL